MRSFLEVEGLYNPSIRFAFTNITAEIFESKWDGIPIVVQPNETIEISNITPIPGAGHALAIKMTGELVDKIMIGEVKMSEFEYYKNNPGAQVNSFRAPNSLGVPAARKVWEDQILRELDPEEESPMLQSIRKQMKEEILSGSSEKQNAEPVHIPTSIQEFAELKKPVQSPKAPKSAAKVKSIKK